jgi:hypothetical protein
MEWNSWGMGGFVSTVFDSSHSYAFLGEVGLHVVTDGALDGWIFIGCCEHLQGAGLGCIDLNVIVMCCDGTRANPGGIPLFSHGASAGGSALLDNEPGRLSD